MVMLDGCPVCEPWESALVDLPGSGSDRDPKLPLPVPNPPLEGVDRRLASLSSDSFSLEALRAKRGFRRSRSTTRLDRLRPLGRPESTSGGALSPRSMVLGSEVSVSQSVVVKLRDLAWFGCGDRVEVAS